MSDLHFPNYSAAVNNGNVAPEIIKEFQQFVFAFYTKNGRHEMVWRHTTDPYLITVSEVMLQQTQVPRVETIYPQFIRKFPTLDTLASAAEADVLSAWQGMGYNRRALSLQKLCRIIRDEYNGVFPDNPDILVKLPGIGPATSCSIAAFAFNRPVVFIETNIRRIFIHCFFRDRESIDDTELKPLVAAALPQSRAREWYWALMDLGSAMKPVTGNPNRKSTQYVKQPAFSGSTRQTRGAILKHLLTVKTATTQELAEKFALPEPQVRKILEAMTSEGFFVRQTADTWTIKNSQTP
ncbi:MAG TPA: A/G-specific adenine glycosylase [Methanocorpusculum sp.]|nr:A/G-specific adenine glycosylase [Methanocorpusculum sp.]